MLCLPVIGAFVLEGAVEPVWAGQTELPALEAALVQPMAKEKAGLADPSQLLTSLETAGPASRLV